ncbi:MAG: hypothetical protein Q8L28_00540 [bacterium]|nr:hypothetical protein [bacterium]
MKDLITDKPDSENLNGKPERTWKYRRPTVLVESQSAPVLKGDPAEQSYMRAFPLTSPKDLVVTDFELNACYITDYLGSTLGFDLPKFVVVPKNGSGCLSENLMSSNDSVGAIRDWHLQTDGLGKIQFFNVTESEKKLAEKVGVEATCGDINKAIEIGSKTGFRRLCEKLGVPMPEGYICGDEVSTEEAIGKLFGDGKNVLIKSENGTGGTELKSNILLSQSEYENSKLPFKEYVSQKLGYFDGVLGKEWVVEEVIQGDDGSIHAYIQDQLHADPSFVLGAISENNSYVGGYWPFVGTSETEKMRAIVDQILIPELQKTGVYGYHCFDFKDGKFLEDNVRQGALDFIDGTVARAAEIHFPGQNYAFWHSHVPVSRPTNFNEVWAKFKPYLTPTNNFNHLLGIVTNPEVLPFGRSLDLTAVSFGQGSSLGRAKRHFEELVKIVRLTL